MNRQRPLPTAGDGPLAAEKAPPLTAEEKQFLLGVARQAIHDSLNQTWQPRFESESPALQQLRATFVTLRRRESGELRGCRGEAFAQRPLIESVALMAIAAATDDPRFFPVSLAELPLLHIEISALTTPVPISPEAVEVGQHGLLLVKGLHRGLLLPQVPLNYGWDRVTFLDALCHKAGLPRNSWREPSAQLFGFETEVWGEEE